MKLVYCMLTVSYILVASGSSAERLTYVESSEGLEPPQFEGGRTEVEMADLNNDGDIDLVSIGDHGSPWIGTDQHGIMVWFGDGEGNWSVYMNGNFGYGGIAVGDVNNDGYPDLGYGMHHNYSGDDFGDQLLEVALGDGTGQSWMPWDDGLATNGESWGMFCTDFLDVDNDSDLDLGANSFGCCAGVHIYLNQSDGTWVQSFGFLGGNSGEGFVFGDINNDGNADFAVAHQNGTVYLGDGVGGFTLGDGNLPPPGLLGYSGPDLGDVDNDGGDDLSFSNSDGGVEVWVWEEPDTWLDFSGSLPSSGVYEATQLFDMNVDGYIDMAAFGHGQLTVWLGNGEGEWVQDANFTTPSPGYSSAFRVGGDADHNGYPDIAIVADEGSWPNDRNQFHFYKETSVPESLTIKPVYPRGYETLLANSVRSIEWVSGVPGGDTSLVRLELSTTGAQGTYSLIGDNLPNNGRYQWIVPDAIYSTNCYISYTVATASDTATALTAVAFKIFPSIPVPDIHTTPCEFDVVLNTGETFTDTLVINNYGNDTLTFEVSEVAARLDEVPWISENPTSGIVPPAEYTEVILIFNSEGLSGGVYSADLLITSNDPDEPEIVIGLELSVNPPGEFSLFLPFDGDTVSLPVALEWEEAVDPDPDDTVYYQLRLAHSSDFSDSFIIDSLSENQITLTNLIPDTTYYWKVKAYDRWGIERWSNQTFNFYILSLSTFVRGDVDGSGGLSLGDGIRCFRCQFMPGWQDSCECDDATDADDNGMISIGDCLRILRKQFVPGWQDSIPPPCCNYPTDCGWDPTADEIGCNAHPCME